MALGAALLVDDQPTEKFSFKRKRQGVFVYSMLLPDLMAGELFSLCIENIQSTVAPKAYICQSSFLEQ